MKFDDIKQRCESLSIKSMIHASELERLIDEAAKTLKDEDSTVKNSWISQQYLRLVEYYSKAPKNTNGTPLFHKPTKAQEKAMALQDMADFYYKKTVKPMEIEVDSNNPFVTTNPFEMQ